MVLTLNSGAAGEAVSVPPLDLFYHLISAVSTEQFYENSCVGLTHLNLRRGPA